MDEERVTMAKARNAYNRDKANEEVFKMLKLEFIISLILPENIHHLLFIIRMFATKSFHNRGILVSHHSGQTQIHVDSFIVRANFCVIAWNLQFCNAWNIFSSTQRCSPLQIRLDYCKSVFFHRLFLGSLVLTFLQKKWTIRAWSEIRIPFKE